MSLLGEQLEKAIEPLNRRTTIMRSQECEESILVLLNNSPMQFKRVLSLMETDHNIKQSEHYEDTIFEESDEDSSSK